MQTSETHVVVLAAGRGSRLGAYSEDAPKWLLPVGDASIADRQMQGIAEVRRDDSGGIASVRVLSGHALPAVERYLADAGSDAEVVENPDYATINNWYSALLAIRSLPPGPDRRLVVINSDLFARPEFYARFIRDAARTEEESLVAVDLERRLTDESMKVAVDGEGSNLLGAIGKVGITQPVGEYVGMLMARGSVLADFEGCLESFCGREEHLDEWYERAVGLTAATGSRWRIWPTESSDWVEIDDDSDYEEATAMAERL